MGSYILFCVLDDFNFGENFQDFSSKMSGTSVLLWGGLAIAAYVLFNSKQLALKDKLMSFLQKTSPTPTTPVKSFNPMIVDGVIKPTETPKESPDSDEEVFFDLIASWKKTRNLCVKAKCEEAVKVCDEMFPLLSVNSCGKDKK